MKLICGALDVVGSLRASDNKSRADDAPEAAGLVDALNGVFGKQTYGRAIHAKGIVLDGEFTPAPCGMTLSKASHLQGSAMPVTVRFSDFAGISTVADTSTLASPRGIAVKFPLRDGGETDIVAHSVNGFPCASAEEFRQLMMSLGSSVPGTPSPTPADRFMASHVSAKVFFDNLPPPPVSFATVAYFGVNSFKFTNANGEMRFGRYQLIPLAGIHFMAKADIASADHDYLIKELQQRVARQSVQFIIQVQLATPGDAISDPSIAWRDSNPTVSLGTLTASHLVADNELTQRALKFNPAAVTDGIASADPMIEARSGAYGASYGRRHPTR